MATKRRRNDKWAYTIRRANLLPQPVYLTFDSEVEGDEYVARLEALLDREIVPDELIKKTEVRKSLRDQVRLYLETQPVADEDRRQLKAAMMKLPRTLDLPDLTYAWAEQWVTDLKRKHHLAPSTIKHNVGPLARALDWVTKKGEIPFNPLRMLKRGYASYTPTDVAAVRDAVGDAVADRQQQRSTEGDERDRRLEDGEEEAIRSIMNGAKPKGKQRKLELRERESLILMFDMALESAMRMREMYTLTMRQIDLDKRTIFLDKTKNGDKRQVPISSVLLRALRPHVDGKPRDQLLFPWWNGDADFNVLKRTTTRLSRQFGRIFASAGCVDLHFHDLRHEATSRIYERTMLSDLEISKITGHKNLAMLRRYSNLRASTLAERLW